MLDESKNNQADMTARAPDAQPDRVRSFPYTADIINCSTAHLRRLVARGEGPRVTRLSARKNGIRDSHREAWLAARVA